MDREHDYLRARLLRHVDLTCVGDKAEDFADLRASEWCHPNKHFEAADDGEHVEKL